MEVLQHCYCHTTKSEVFNSLNRTLKYPLSTTINSALLRFFEIFFFFLRKHWFLSKKKKKQDVLRNAFQKAHYEVSHSREAAEDSHVSTIMLEVGALSLHFHHPVGEKGWRLVGRREKHLLSISNYRHHYPQREV